MIGSLDDLRREMLKRLPSVGFSAVQYGTVTVTNGVASGTATISAVDTTKASVMFLGMATTNAGLTIDDYVSCETWLELTNSTTVTATRSRTASITGTLTIGFVVITWANAKSVQTFTINLSSTLTGTATITSVNTTKTLLFHLGVSTSVYVNYARELTWFTLTNSTTVTATRADGTGALTVRGVAVELL
jgi:hypothetical protein